GRTGAWHPGPGFSGRLANPGRRDRRWLARRRRAPERTPDRADGSDRDRPEPARVGRGPGAAGVGRRRRGRRVRGPRDVASEMGGSPAVDPLLLSTRSRAQSRRRHPLGRYSMDPLLRSIRERDFARLDASGQVYLDHTGSALYPEALVRSHAERLCSAVLGNPHSRSPSSRASTEACKAARARVLEFFNGDPAEYEVIFTANATGGLKLVGEGFPFEPGGRLRMTADNHNSVNGIREFAVRGGADVAYVPIGSDLRVADLESELAGADPERNNLFAYPAQ